MIALAALALLAQPPAPRVLDSFVTLAPWSAAPADGVTMRLAHDRGRVPDAGAMRLEFDFHGRGGWASARRVMAFDLPDNYVFTFYVRGQARPNTLQLKLVDSTGHNVWWAVREDMVVTPQWTKVSIARRAVSFAWGPAGGGTLRHVAALELSLVPGAGGRGSVWVDELALAPLPVVTDATLPTVTGGENTLDFGVAREFGGLDIAWDSTNGPRPYDVELSDEGQVWRTVRHVAHARAGHGGHDFVVLPDAIARYARIVHAGGTIREMTAEPSAFADSTAGRFARLAAKGPRGAYPRYLHGEQPYWTVFGARGGRRTGLLDTDGNVDLGARQAGIEPFVIDRGHVVSWTDVRVDASLDGGDRPMPSVRWRTAEWTLGVTGFGVADTPGVRYRVENTSATPLTLTLVLAVRPFQVDPPWQSLNVAGGPAPVWRIVARNGFVWADSLALRPSERPTAVGATAFADGDITEYLWRDALPRDSAVRDPDGYASGAMTFRIALRPGEAHDVYLNASARALRAARAQWEGPPSVTFDGSPVLDDLARAVRTSVGYILIDARGFELRPGPRSYARSWIRDAALMADALLRAGGDRDTSTVRRFIEWYAPHQYPDGKVPCCVDVHGADPVPELDSDGELIALIAEYVRYTGDRALLERMWPRIVAATMHMDSIRRGDSLGLIPPSISHEGYTGRPEHSVWDDCWALKGYDDAAAMARVLRQDPSRFVTGHDSLSARLNAAVARSGPFAPGAVDLGDYDPASTAIALSPTECGLPAAQVERTFAMYDTTFQSRMAGRLGSYTPYEFRNAGALLRLGLRDRAWAVIDAGVRDRHPAAWNAWPEVAFRDTAAPNVIGDRPHGWIAAEFIRAVLDLFAYSANHDSSLVVGAGVRRDWLTPGVTLRGLRTPFGVFSYREWADGVVVHVHIDPGLRLPPAGIKVVSPLRADTTIVRALPADVTFK